jgi:hypothetical protein
MATQFPPKKNAAYTMYVSLVSQANTKVMQSNPTLAAGDVKVSTDGGALANLTTLPVVTPASSKAVKVDLSASEMNGDNIVIIFSDAAGAEWCDLGVNLQTAARQIDDLAYPTVSGRSTDVSATGEVGLDFDNIKDASGAHTLTNITVPIVTTAQNLTTNNDKTGYGLSAAAVQAIWDALTSALTTAGSIGKRLVDNIDAAISSRSTYAGGAVASVTGSVGSVATGGITAASFAAGAIDSAAIATDAIGSAELAASAVTEIQAAILSDATPFPGTRIDATISSRLASASYTTPDNTTIAAIAGYVDTEVAAIKAKTDLIPAAGPASAADYTAARAAKLDNLDAALTTRATPAQVNAEVVDALAVDTYAEPGQGVPAATAPLAAKINYLFKAWRNKKTQTSAQYSLYADDATTVDQKATVGDDGTTTTIGEITTGP